MSLPKEVESYRKKINTIYWNKPTPRLTAYKWDSDIEPSNLYSLGEEGAERYLKGKNLGEKSLIFFALYAESLGREEMANGFWKRAYLKSCEPPSSKGKKNRITKVKINKEQKNIKPITSFHEFWFALIRNQKKYSCYSLFLLLPSDKEAIRYLKEYNDTLQLISSSNILIIVAGSNQYLHDITDNDFFSVELKRDYPSFINSFGVDFTMLPSMVVFEGIHLIKEMPGTSISLKNMTAEEISEKMKVVFTIIEKSIRAKESPIGMLQKHKKDEQLKHAGKEIIGKAINLLDYPFKVFIQEVAKQFAQKMTPNSE